MCRGDHRFPEKPRLNHNKTESRCNLVLIAAAFITAYSIHNGNVEKMSDRLNPLFGIGCILSAQNLVVLVDSVRNDLLRGYHLRSHPYDKRSGSELQIRSRAVTVKFCRIFSAILPSPLSRPFLYNVRFIICNVRYLSDIAVRQRTRYKRKDKIMV